MNPSEMEQLLLPNESALSFIKRKNKRPLRTGISPFDQSTLNGQGIVPGDIVEIYGNQSCGASQICMTICLNCIMPQIDPEDNIQSLQEKQAESNCDVLFFDIDFRFDEIQLVIMLEERIYTTFMNHICENKKWQGIEPYNQVDQMEYDQYFATIFPTDESFSIFINSCIARVKVVRPPDAFSFWMTVESLIQNEKDMAQENKVASPNYGCIIVDSLTGVFYYQHSFQYKNWERACDALTRLARQNDISVFATVRETFSKESRKKYKNELFTNNEYNRQFYSEEQRKMEEMFILHREMMPSVWKDRINYRLIIEEDERATHGGYLAILCAVASESNYLAYKRNERRVIKPKRLYKYNINNCGVIWE
jgi:RecA/RadA recombinase